MSGRPIKRTLRVHTAHISLTCLEAMPDDD